MNPFSFARIHVNIFSKIVKCWKINITAFLFVDICCEKKAERVIAKKDNIQLQLFLFFPLNLNSQRIRLNNPIWRKSLLLFRSVVRYFNRQLCRWERKRKKEDRRRCGAIDRLSRDNHQSTPRPLIHFPILCDKMAVEIPRIWAAMVIEIIRIPGLRV